ncbi:MAG: uroporphyrinogen decarboxylase family protein [Bacteroidota bacterium]
MKKNGKELIRSAFGLEETERIPWVPFVGSHGGTLIEKNAKEYLQSADSIVAGVDRAIELYNPDGLPVMFDLQVEAEALGCDLVWAEDNPPAVVSHPLLSDMKLEDLKIPGLDDGRIGLVMEACRRSSENHPDVALYGLITGPFTLALHLLGTEIFIKMFEDEQYVHELMSFTKRVGIFMAEQYIASGCDVVSMVDPMTSQIDPEQFRQFVLPAAEEIFTYIREKGALSSFFVCGYAQQNIKVMCDCKPDNISIDENIPLDYVKDVCLENNISFGGNMKLTVVLLMGTVEDCQTNAMECMELGGSRGFVLAPGCDLPMDTPVENLQAITELVHDPYKQDVVKAFERSAEDVILPNMADYGQSDKVIVDIITLDSESCAPCQYMVESVQNIAPEFEGIIEWREHSIKKFKAVTFMNALMVKNLPTICIDGKIAFTSKIPPKQELIETIQQRINKKLRMKIRAKRAEVLILGKTEEECSELEASVKSGMTELGVSLDLKKIVGEEEMRSYGISRSPALMVVDYKVKTQGGSPNSEVVKEWIKEVM